MATCNKTTTASCQSRIVRILDWTGSFISLRRIGVVTLISPNGCTRHNFDINISLHKLKCQVDQLGHKCDVYFLVSEAVGQGRNATGYSYRFNFKGKLIKSRSSVTIAVPLGKCTHDSLF